MSKLVDGMFELTVGEGTRMSELRTRMSKLVNDGRGMFKLTVDEGTRMSELVDEGTCRVMPELTVGESRETCSKLQKRKVE